MKFAFAMEFDKICDVGDEMKEEVQTSRVDCSTGTTSHKPPIIATEQASAEVLHVCLI